MSSGDLKWGRIRAWCEADQDAANRMLAKRYRVERQTIRVPQGQMWEEVSAHRSLEDAQDQFKACVGMDDSMIEAWRLRDHLTDRDVLHRIAAPVARAT